MKTYKELTVWQKSYQLVLEIYKITGSFPKDETYGLTSQLRRAGVSVPANIAEGFNRRTKLEYLQYLYIARGSLQELSFLLLLAKDLKYLTNDRYNEIIEIAETVGRLLSGLCRAIKEK